MSNDELVFKVILITIYMTAVFAGLITIWSVISKIRGKKIKTSWTGLLTWLIIILLLLIPLIWNRIIFQIIILLLSLLCFKEYSQVTGLWKDKRLILSCYITILIIYYPVFRVWYGLYQAIPLYAMALVLVVPIMINEYQHMVQKVCLSILGVFYFGWFFSHLAYFKNIEKSNASIYLLILLVVANEAFGYMLDKLIGKHKLVPRIDSNKTIEGALGSLIGILFLALLLRNTVPFMGLWHILLIAFLLSVFGTCGNLTISYIKSDLKIEEREIPISAYSGILNRFDSLLFTAPLYFHFMRYFYGHLGNAW